MFDLHSAVDRWLDEVVAQEPILQPYTDEIADHIISASEAEIAAGVEPATAFANAIDALGRPAVLADEFSKDGGVAAVLHRLTKSEAPPSKREQLTIAAAWVLMSLFWAGVMIAINESSTWVIFAWIFTTYLPLTAIGAMVNKRGEKPATN